MDIKKTMLKEKVEVLERYKITAEYLQEQIQEEDNIEDRKEDLKRCQANIDELEKIINFLKA